MWSLVTDFFYSTFLKFTHVIACNNISFPFLLPNNIPLVNIPHLFTLSAVKGIFGLFCGLLWITLLWTLMYKFLCGHVFIYLRHGTSTFNILRNCQTIFQNSCTILHYHQHCMSVLIPPHPSQHMLLAVFFIVVLLVCVKWYLIMVLFCISIMVNDFEHLFMLLLIISVSFLENVHSDPLLT